MKGYSNHSRACKHIAEELKIPEKMVGQIMRMAFYSIKGYVERDKVISLPHIGILKVSDIKKEHRKKSRVKYFRRKWAEDRRRRKLRDKENSCTFVQSNPEPVDLPEYHFDFEYYR